MRKYETLVLLSPELAADARQGVVENLIAIIEREGGTGVVIDDWGARELAYAVNKLTRGYFVRLEYGAPNNVVAELERNIRITEGIMKFITVKLDDVFEAAAQPEAAPAAETQA